MLFFTFESKKCILLCYEELVASIYPHLADKRFPPIGGGESLHMAAF